MTTQVVEKEKSEAKATEEKTSGADFVHGLSHLTS